jgi:hypothetical protein
MASEKYIVTVDEYGTEWRNEEGKLHRLDGPAVKWWDGHKEWWIEGKKYTEAQFNEKVNQLH